MTNTAADELSGLQKCAILCLALGPDEASVILGQLSPPQVDAVTREITHMNRVDAEVVNSVLEEYRSGPVGQEFGVEGGIESAQRLLSLSLGEPQAVAILDRVRTVEAQDGLAQLQRVEPRMFANLFADEHPQTIAVILSRLDMKQAARAIDELPPDLASDILFRMAQMEAIHPETLSLLESGLRGKTDLSLSQETAAPGDAARVAKLINMAAGTRGDQLLDKIGERNKELASRIRALMFVFEDLMLIDGKGIQRVLRELESKDLSLSLKGASAELREHIFTNMSSRAADAMREEMELLGAVRVSEVEEAQQRIMAEVRQLEESGEIMVAREGDSNEFIS